MNRPMRVTQSAETLTNTQHGSQLYPSRYSVLLATTWIFACLGTHFLLLWSSCEKEVRKKEQYHLPAVYQANNNLYSCSSQAPKAPKFIKSKDASLTFRLHLCIDLLLQEKKDNSDASVACYVGGIFPKSALFEPTMLADVPRSLYRPQTAF